MEKGPDCLDNNTIAAYIDGTLQGEERQRAERHMAECDYCRELMASAAGLERDASEDDTVH